MSEQPEQNSETVVDLTTDDTADKLIQQSVESLPRPEKTDNEAPPATAKAPKSRGEVRYRGATTDPVFGYIIAISISIGLIPLLPEGADMRYTLTWGTLAAFGVTAWLLGNGERIGQEKPENVVWGVVIGLLVGLPLYLFGQQTLASTSNILFDGLTSGALLAYLIFVMPLGETLFFRGLMHKNYAFWIVAGQSTIWSMVMFFPAIRNLNEFWAVAVFIGIALAIVNVVYSWVRERNGLAAAWLCQIVVNVVIIFLPFVSR